MKTAVVYYSLEGNTRYAAEKIALLLGADLLPLTPVKAYPGGKFAKYFFAGKSAVFREKPKLAAYSFAPANYDLIVLATPTWAGTFAPPLRSFLRAQDLGGRKAALVACCSGGSTDKLFSDLRGELPGCQVISSLRLVTPQRGDRQEADRAISAFCAELTGQA
ncbi:MAG: flavodoxin family protein [Christensenellales bacterium]